MNTSQFNNIVSDIGNFQLMKQSFVEHESVNYGMVKIENEQKLVIIAPTHEKKIAAFQGESHKAGGIQAIIAPLSAENAFALRSQLPWLQSQCLGLEMSAGMGDRLGLATPGHIHALRKLNGKIRPIFAQQSIRENNRSGRTPQQVLDEAMWGAFQENWQEGFGTDADHLKNTDDIDVCLAAGYTFFTIDPGDHVDNRAETADLDLLQELALNLPSELQATQSSLLNKTFTIEQLNVTFDEFTLLKAMVKYGRAIWHVSQMYSYLQSKSGSEPFEFEVSVDETENPTSHAEHIYIASELKRLGVNWISLAPRYVGRFEKGVDYIGDLDVFDQDIKGHAAIARYFGPYKLSLHSGSDKYSIYQMAVKATRGIVHLKTAGTSYLEALRTIAELDPTLFTEIYSYSKERYDTDKLTYHVSAQVDKAPDSSNLSDYTEILNNFDAREILHVAFGSVLNEKNPDGTFRFYNRLMQTLRNHPDEYAINLECHFLRHLNLFVQS